MRPWWALPVSTAVILSVPLVGCGEDPVTVPPTATPTETEPGVNETPTGTSPGDTPTQGTTPTPTATEPGGPTPTQPGGPTPTQPGGPTPTQPGGPTPTQPGGPTPTQPGGPTPTQPTGPTPTETPATTPPPTPPPNSVPVVSFTAPADGSVFFEGQSVTFEGLVSDFESAPSELALRIDSDVDGLLINPSAALDGTFSVGVFGLTVGDHVITLSATDPGGQTGTASIDLTVDARAGVPTIVITSPTTLRYQEGETVSFAATVGDDEDASTDLEVTWTSSQDGELSRSFADVAGDVGFSTSSLSRGNHIIGAAVEDTDGNTAEAGVSLTINGPPSDPVISFNPSSPGTNDDLVAEAFSEDEEGDTLVYTYSWTVDGEATAYTTQTVPASATTRGEVWAVTVTASDPDVSSGATEASVTIVNTAPTATGATLSPNAATVDSTLTCAGQGFADADGDASSYTYSWEINGEAIFGVTEASLRGVFEKGDVVVCYVAPYDGFTSGTKVSSNAVTIANSAPMVSQAVVSPSSGVTEASTLTCQVNSSRDADGDTITFSYQWKVNSAVVSGVSSNTLTGTHFNKGDIVACEVTPNDGTTNGSTFPSPAVLVENSVPTITSISISPSSPSSSDVLTCNTTKADLDPADTVTLAYTWTLDNSPVAGQTSATLPAGTAQRGQAVRCTATPSDGESTGETVTSDPVSLDNTAPTLTGATVTPNDPTTDSTLVCSPFGFNDPDGDDPSFFFAWTIDGVASDVVADTLTGDNFVKGQQVRCIVTPSDGFVSGSPVTSSAVTIRNSTPVVSGVAISPTSPSVNSTLVCQSSASDADDDTVTLTHVWAINGGVAAGENSATLTPGLIDNGDVVTCSVTPNDGETSGATVTSEPVTVGNLSPTDPVVEILPADPLPGEPLTVNITTGSTDPDGGDVSYVYRWYVDGVESAYDTANIPSFVTADGEEWQVEVVATDGSATSDEAVDAVLVTEPDADNDGWGLFSDCDDADAAQHPGAAEVNNGADDDCDGVSDNRWVIQHPYGRDDVGEVSAIGIHSAGAPQMLFLDRSHNTVRYSRVVGESALFMDTPDEPLTALQSSAYPLAITVDDTDTPHVALYDSTSQSLVYGVRIEGGWLTQVVDGDGQVGSRPAIAIDAFGVVHMVYRDDTTSSVKYARGFLGYFEISTLETGLTGAVGQDVAVDFDGVAHAVWQGASAGSVRYARIEDGVAELESIDTTASTGEETRVAIDPVTGDVHVAWVDVGNTVQHATGGQGAWTKTAALSGVNVVGRIALAVNPATGAPHVLAYDGTAKDLYHSHAESGAWVSGVGVAFRDALGSNPSMVIDTNQTLHAAFYDADDKNPLYATAKANGGWAFTVYAMESVDSTGTWNDVAVGTDGNPRLFTYGQTKETGAETAVYLGQDGTGYRVRVPNPNATAHAYGQLETSADNTVHLLEYDPTTYSLTYLQSATGVNFTSTTLVNDLITTNGVSMDVTGPGGIYIAYTDYWGARPLVCGVANANYTEVTLIRRAAGQASFTRQAIAYTCSSSSTMPLASPSVAASAQGIHVAFYRQSNGDLIYMAADAAGTFGTPETVDSSDDTGYKPSIALNPATGYPGIAHLNRTTGKLRVSTRGAVGWLTTNVADAFVNGPVVLRYDASGNAHLLFRDSTGRRLQYATNRSGIFITEVLTVKSDATGLGTSASMELDADGNPHITFSDVTATDVGYVRGKLFDHTF